MFQSKARSPKPKLLWGAVNEKMGKFKDSIIELQDNDTKIKDTDTVANMFATFFLGKVEKLSTEPIIYYQL